MKTLKVMTMGLLTLLIISCASSQKAYISPQYNSVLYGKRISVITREGGKFRGVGKAGVIKLGQIGSLAIGSGTPNKNNSILNYYNLHDPVQEIAQTVVQVLAQRYQLKNVNSTIKAKNHKVVSVSTNSDLVLDIKTANWGLYKYVSQLKLIDIKSSKVLAQGSCTFDANKHSRSAGMRRVSLLANNAALLKNRMGEAKSYCIKRFINMLLNQRR